MKEPQSSFNPWRKNPQPELLLWFKEENLACPASALRRSLSRPYGFGILDLGNIGWQNNLGSRSSYSFVLGFSASVTGSSSAEEVCSLIVELQIFCSF